LYKLLNPQINKETIYIDEHNRAIEKIESDIKTITKSQFNKIQLLRFYIKKYREMCLQDYKIKVGLIGMQGAGITAAFNKFLGYSKVEYTGENKPLWLKIINNSDEDKNSEAKIQLVSIDQHANPNKPPRNYSIYKKAIEESFEQLPHDYCVLYLNWNHIKSYTEKTKNILSKLELIDFPGIDNYFEKYESKIANCLINEVDIIVYFIKNQNIDEPMADNFIEFIRSKELYKNEINYLYNYSSNGIGFQTKEFNEIKQKIIKTFPDHQNHYFINNNEISMTNEKYRENFERIFSNYTTNKFEYYISFLKRKLLNKIFGLYSVIFKNKHEEDDKTEKDKLKGVIKSEKSLLDKEVEKYYTTIDNNKNILLNEVDGIKSNYNNSYGKLEIGLKKIIESRFDDFIQKISSDNNYNLTIYRNLLNNIKNEFKGNVEENLADMNREANDFKKYIDDIFAELVKESPYVIEFLGNLLQKIKNYFASDLKKIEKLQSIKNDLIDKFVKKLNEDSIKYTKDKLVENISGSVERFFKVILQPSDYTKLSKIIAPSELGEELRTELLFKIFNADLDRVNDCIKNIFSDHKSKIWEIVDTYFNEEKQRMIDKLNVDLNNSRFIYLNPKIPFFL